MNLSSISRIKIPNSVLITVSLALACIILIIATGTFNTPPVTLDPPSPKSDMLPQQKRIFNEPHQPIKRHPPGERCIKRLPQAIVVGIQKCGTSAILTFLNKHPQIAAMMHPPEAKFFTMHSGKPLEYYRNMMPCSYSNQITIEKSPPYFYRPYCAKKIWDMNSNTKIIVIVKDPIVRAQSNYAMRVAHRKKVPSFESLVVKSGKISSSQKFIRFSRYSSYMAGWLRYLKLNQMHFVDGHALETDPSATLTKVENFLEIGNFFTPEKFNFNVSKGKYCYLNDCLGSNKGREHPTIRPDVQQMLEEYFKPLNERFFELIQQRFNWGY